jgi:hypothetical protein
MTCANPIVPIRRFPVNRSTLRPLLLVMSAALLSTIATGTVVAQTPSAQSHLPPYQVEWVYRVKWGESDEFWRLFRKYQIPLLDKEKQLGRVLRYTVYRPGLHTSEDQRWDYRVVITYRDIVATTESRDLPKQVFPDQATFKREENQRWSITVAHYDLPIREVDPHAADE